MTAIRLVDVTEKLLAAWPLPGEDPHGDKEDRGHVLVVAGSREMPGAAILAATAALRAGAGKLTIATAQSVSLAVAVAMPEARVIGLPETPSGGFTKAGARLLHDCALQSSATVIGPGMMDARGSMPFITALMEKMGETPVVLDALAMEVLKRDALPTRKVLITPHAGEMCNLTGLHKDHVQQSGASAAFEFAQQHGIFVALKGPASYVAAWGETSVWRHQAKLPGLGTSGSGDVLAGIVAGLAARGAPLNQAAVWGVAAHAWVGKKLGMARTGFLARELLTHIPDAVMPR